MVLRRLPAGADQHDARREPDDRGQPGRRHVRQSRGRSRRSTQPATSTTQLSDSLRARVAFNNSWSRTKGLLPSLNGTDRTDTNYDKISTFPNYSVSGNMDWVASQRLFFGVRGGYYMADQHDTNVTVQPLYRFGNTSNVGFLDVPVPPAAAGRVHEHPDNTQVVRDQQTRAYFQADGTWYAKAGGDHQFKFGVQARPRRQQRPQRRVAPARHGRWNTRCSAACRAAPYGYYTVRSNGADPTKGFITEGQHPHHQHRPVHPGRVDDRQQADGQRRPPNRA